MSGIERAARALLASESESTSWEFLDAVSQEKLKDHVRSILNVIREPDINMMEAGAEIVRYVGPHESDEAHLGDAANVWRFMIDVLLGEKDNS